MPPPRTAWWGDGGWAEGGGEGHGGRRVPQTLGASTGPPCCRQSDRGDSVAPRPEAPRATPVLWGGASSALGRGRWAWRTDWWTKSPFSSVAWPCGAPSPGPGRLGSGPPPCTATCGQRPGSVVTGGSRGVQGIPCGAAARGWVGRASGHGVRWGSGVPAVPEGLGRLGVSARPPGRAGFRHSFLSQPGAQARPPRGTRQKAEPRRCCRWARRAMPGARYAAACLLKPHTALPQG